MRIALIGFGKMGREIDAIAREQGETVARVFELGSEVRPDALDDVDVCIDFSMPEAVLPNVLAAAQAKRDIVCGTPGWYQHLQELKDRVKDSGLLYSANFSLGMNLFLRMVRHAAELMNRATEYDPFVHEIHHRQKVDSPSGTALRLGQILVDSIERKKI